MLDRIDLYVVMNEPSVNEKVYYNSMQLHERVICAFKKQKQRAQNDLNGKLSDKEIKKFCKLDDSSNELLNKAIVNYKLSFRSINKILKVSRTIADLNNNENITKEDLMKALSYRKR